jgi:hypothetical protein
MHKPCFIISFPTSPNVLRQAWINVQLRITVSVFVAFLHICYVVCYSHIPCTLFIHEVKLLATGIGHWVVARWKSPHGPVRSYKMIDLNSTGLWHAIRYFLLTLQILFYRPTTFVIRASLSPIYSICVCLRPQIISQTLWSSDGLSMVGVRGVLGSMIRMQWKTYTAIWQPSWRFDLLRNRDSKFELKWCVSFVY